MDGGAWWATVHGVAKSRTRLSDFTFTFFHFQWRNRHKRTDLWTRGEDEMYIERNMETHITICKIDSQQEFAVSLRKLKQGLCINLERWGGEEDRKEVQVGEDICTSIADSC